MEINGTYKFQISLSRNGYETKLQARAAITGDKGLMTTTGVQKRIGYYSTSATSQELLDYVLHGHTFCALFSGFPAFRYEVNKGGKRYKKIFINEDGDFTMCAKADEFFVGSYFIGIDMDENSFQTSHSLISRLSLPPTFWYTSFSHMQTDKDTGKSKGVRLRLIYVFDKMITDKYFFRYCSWTLHKMIERDLEEPISDPCGMKCAQYFNGTYCGNTNLVIESELSNNIYSLSDINISDAGYYDFLQSDCHYDAINKEKKESILKRLNDLSNRSLFSDSNIILTPPSPPILSESEKNERNDFECYFDRDLLRHAKKMSWDKFYNIYRQKYPYVYRTEQEEWLTIGDIKYQLCDENYLELMWIPTTDSKGNPLRITDGHHRRNKLFHRAWLRRVIMPEITPSILLFNLLVDRERFFDNSDGVLSLELLKDKVVDSFMFDIETLKARYSYVYDSTRAACKNKKFIIHWSCREKANARSIAKELHW